MTQAEFDALIQSLLEEGYTVDELEASASQGNFEDDFGISLPNFAVGINAQTAIQGAAQKANSSVRTANRIKKAQCNRSGGFNKGQGDNHECLQGAEAAAHIATIGENAPAYDRGQEWLANNPQEGPELTQWQQNAQIIVDRVESGSLDVSEADQRWYDKWVRSGSPSTQDGMLSDPEYDRIVSVESGNANAIYNVLIDELGWDPEEAYQIILDVLLDPTNQNAVTIEGQLANAGYYSNGILQNPEGAGQTEAVDTDGDGIVDTVVRIDADGNTQVIFGQDISEEVEAGIKEKVRNEQIYDSVTSEEGFEELEDWEKNAKLKDAGYTWNDDWFGDGSTEEPLSEEKLVRDYGQEAVDKAKEIYNGVEDWVEGAIEDPLGALKGVLDQVYSGMPEECKESNTNKPDDWWKDCTNLSVLGQIPGLPIPLPPGTIDVNTTVRDLEDAAKEAGKTLEDIFNPTCTGTPAEIQECENRTISDIIGDWASDVWDDIKGAWDDLAEKTEQGLLNILVDFGYNILSGWIFTQIKDAVTLDEPLAFFPIENCNNAEWLEQASAQEIALCNSAVNCEEQGLTGGIVKDIGECVDPDPNDCEGQNKSINSDGSCGDCLGSLKEIGGECVEPCQYNDTIAASSPECKEPWTDDGDTEAECAAQGRLHVPGDAATETDSECGDCLPTHTDKEGNGTCTEWTDGGPTKDECEADGRVHRPSNGTGKDSSCGGCLDGYEIQGTECVEESIEEPCPGEQIRNEETRECEDPPPDFTEGEPCTTTDNQPGTYDSQGTCVPDWVNEGPTVDQCQELKKTHIPADPSEQKDSDCGDCQNPQWNPIGDGGECLAPVECWDGSTKPTEAECPEKVCDESSFQEEVVETTTTPYGQPQPRVQAPTYTEVNGVCTKTTYEVVVADPTQEDCEAEGKELSTDGKSCVEPTGETPCKNGATLESGCEQCEDGSVPSDYKEGKCGGTLIVTPETCGPETFTSERKVEVSVGAGEVKEPSVAYTVENEACTKVTTVYVAGAVVPPPPSPTQCADGTVPPEGQECVQCPEGSPHATSATLAGCGSVPQPCPNGGVRDSNGNCPPPTDECTGEITAANADKCGKKLCNGVYIDKEEECIPGTVCDDGEKDFGNAIGCEQPCPDNDTIGASDAACGGGGCVDDPQTREEKLACGWILCQDAQTVVKTREECGNECENGALDWPACVVCADGSLPDDDYGCGSGPPPLDCDDLDYAAANPLECPGVCEDCTCPEYVAANPEECGTTPPPPPPPPPPPEGGGGGGSGGGGTGEIKPLSIAGDPELLARQEFPITDYLSGLFTGRG